MGFPSGSVVNNPSANAGDAVSIPGLGKSHIPRSNQAHAPQLVSLCSRAQGPRLLKLAHPRACAPKQERPLQWEPRALQLESSL